MFWRRYIGAALAALLLWAAPLAAQTEFGGFNFSNPVQSFGTGGFFAAPQKPAAVAAAAAYTTGAVLFDGTNDYMTLASNFATAVDGKVGTISLWVREQGDGAIQDWLTLQTATLNGIFIRKSAANGLLIDGYDPVPAFKMERQNVTAVVAADGWTHHYFTWDLANSICRYYRNGAADEGAVTVTNVVLDYTTGQVRFGANGDTAGSKLNADVAELYINLDAYIAPTAGNLALFRSSAGKPVDLGATCSTPTGSAPTACYRRASGAAASTFANDISGNGNNMTITGTLTNSATSPTD